MPINQRKEDEALIKQLLKEGAQPEDESGAGDWIFSGQATIEIDGVEVTLREAYAMRRKAEKGKPIREQIQEYARRRFDELHPPD